MESSKPSIRHLSPEKTAVILDGAIQVFLEQGYAGTTMDRIATASGVSKPTIYNHFQDKEDLFNSLMEKLVQEKEWAKYPPDLQNFSTEPPEFVLKRIANEVLDSCCEPSEMITFMRLVIGESGRFPELGKACVKNLDKPILDELSNYFHQIQIPDPEATARIFMGTLVHYLIINLVLNGADIVPMDRDRLVENLIGLIIKN